ncbi:HXXEE domain-containing protein [Rhizobium sp. XQZ8]|uniref:HXXEE domain-containing protein n=1 Tax=Rhizobium populisoli TaxID=2859785 RepID=UPI001C663459|nr:HXXEE domain-containing protein [Rhizobium populisoli]MBW6426115.1 HXXEE domain-containing protein [Rhizobium populisoli]
MGALDRITGNWVYGGSLAGLLLLALTPLFVTAWSWPLVSVFLQLPVYMLHQFEEHDAGRFGAFINAQIGGGRVVLPDSAIFVINVPGVWGINAIALWLAVESAPGFGLVAVYLTLVNAIVHIGPAIVLRRYNPGLITAIVLFLPLSVWALAEVSALPGTGLGHHVLGLGSAVLIHMAIVAYVFRNKRRNAGLKEKIV